MAKDAFGRNVERIIAERTNPDSLSKALKNIHFDVVCDNLAYCSNDVKYLLDSVKAERYIMTSTVSVYDSFHDNIVESEFNPVDYNLNWCSRQDFAYDEIKRQAECALFQQYSHLPSAAVRFPYVIGEDDYTKRFLFYVEHTIKGISMNIDNLDCPMGFISSNEAGKFLSWLTEQSFSGSINGASDGCISLRTVLEYVERITGRKPIISPDGESAPYNRTLRYSVNTDKAKAIGYTFANLNDWIYNLLDKLIKDLTV